MHRSLSFRSNEASNNSSSSSSSSRSGKHVGCALSIYSRGGTRKLQRRRVCIIRVYTYTATVLSLRAGAVASPRDRCTYTRVLSKSIMYVYANYIYIRVCISELLPWRQCHCLIRARYYERRLWARFDIFSLGVGYACACACVFLFRVGM